MEWSTSSKLLVFRLGEQCYALPLARVERIVRAVEVTPLPGAPPLVLGVIDVGGSLLPVFNLRRRFLLPEREVHPGDQFLIASTALRRIALVIDGAWGVVAFQEPEITGSTHILPGLELIQGVVRLGDGLVLIHDLEQFLSLEDALALGVALDRSVR